MHRVFSSHIRMFSVSYKILRGITLLHQKGYHFCCVLLFSCCTTLHNSLCAFTAVLCLCHEMILLFSFYFFTFSFFFFFFSKKKKKKKKKKKSKNKTKPMTISDLRKNKVGIVLDGIMPAYIPLK